MKEQISALNRLTKLFQTKSFCRMKYQGDNTNNFTSTSMRTTQKKQIESKTFF